MNNPSGRKKIYHKIGYALGAVVALTVIFVATQSYLDNKYRTIISEFARSIGPNWSLTYSDVKVSPFMGRVVLNQASIKYQQNEILRVGDLTLSDLQQDSGQMTHAKINAQNILFSPTGADISKISNSADQTVVVKGDANFEYQHDPKTNSYATKNLNFVSREQNLNLIYAEGRIDNLVITPERALQSFQFAINDASFDKGAGTDKKTTRFSSAFGYSHPPSGVIEINNFKLTLPDQNESIGIARAAFQQRDQNRIPLAMAVEILGIDAPISWDTASADFWKPYGYTRFNADIKFNYAFDSESKKIKFNFGLALPQMFTSTLSMDLIGIDLEAMAKDPNLSFSYDAAKIESGLINFTDASLLKKTFEIQSQQKNIPLSDYTLQLGQSIDQSFIPDPAKPDPAMVDIAGKLKAYLNTLGTVTISMKPAEAVPFSQVVVGIIVDRIKLLHVMGVTVTTS